MRSETLLNKTTARNYLRMCSAQDARYYNETLHNIKMRYVAGELSEADYKTLKAYYEKEKQHAANTSRKKLSKKKRRGVSR